MESTNMSKHFLTLQAQRAHYLPAIHSLSQEELWRVTREGKWSIGEHFYHLYLILKMLHTATKYSLFLTPSLKCEETSHSLLKYMIFMKNINPKKDMEWSTRYFSST